jgi:sugar lactone lactonase YvrE
MKIIKTIGLILIFFLTFSSLSTQKVVTTKAVTDNPLKIEKIIGLSKEPGTFHSISSEGTIMLPRYQQGLAVASDGTIFIGDDGEGQIEVFADDLRSKYNFGSLGSGDGQFQRLVALMIDKKDQIYAVDNYLGNIQIFSKEGKFLRKFATTGQGLGQLIRPTDIAVLPSGDFLVMDMMKGPMIYSKDGVYKRNFSSHEYLKPRELISPFDEIPYRVAVSEADVVYITLHTFHEVESPCSVLAYDLRGNFLGTVLDREDQEELMGGFLPDLEVVGKSLYLVISCQTSSDCIIKYKIPDKPNEKLILDTIIAKQKEDAKFLETKDISNPSAIALKNGKIYCLDRTLNRLIVFSEKVEYLGTIQSPILSHPLLYKLLKIDNPPKEILCNPQGIDIDSQNRIFVANNVFSCVNVFDRDGNYLNTMGKRYKYPKEGEEDKKTGDFESPTGITVDKKGNIFVSDTGLWNVHIFDKDLKPIKTVPQRDYSFIQGIKFDSQQNLLVVDSSGRVIRKHNKQEGDTVSYQYSKDIKLDGDWPVDLAVNSKNEIIVPYMQSSQVQILDQDGKVKRTIGEFGNKPGQFYSPQGIVTGPNDHFYIAETDNGRIQKFAPNGTLLWCQNLNWYGLSFISMDNQGKIYVTDCVHGVVLVLSENTSENEDEIVITLKINDPFMTVNGVRNEIDPGNGTMPMIIKGRAFLPIRAIIEALGGTINWQGEEGKITIKLSGKVITLWIGKEESNVNGLEKKIDTPPFISKGRTFIPLRFVTEELGCIVEWDAPTRTIMIRFTILKEQK